MSEHIKIFPISDSAATIELGNCIDDAVNQKVLSMNAWLARRPFAGLKDIIIAYSSLSVYYEPAAVKKIAHGTDTAFEMVKNRLIEAYEQTPADFMSEPKQIMRVPVCYDDKFGYDMDFVAAEKNLTKEEILRLHCSRLYKIYMVGFLPGFAYMGKIDDQLIVPRKLRPEQVPAGSVGITGNQTAIYPLTCPGGWRIIGRTPLTLFDPGAEVPVALSLGGQVEFYPISEQEFYQINPRQ